MASKYVDMIKAGKIAVDLTQDTESEMELDTSSIIDIHSPLPEGPQLMNLDSPINPVMISRYPPSSTPKGADSTDTIEIVTETLNISSQSEIRQEPLDALLSNFSHTNQRLVRLEEAVRDLFPSARLLMGTMSRNDQLEQTLAHQKAEIDDLRAKLKCIKFERDEQRAIALHEQQRYDTMVQNLRELSN